jgi:DNA-binding transcriptional MerR regulator
MPLISMGNLLPDIPPKRYFTIGEVSELCGVKPYVLRYWEQEFSQLRPMKRRGNRRYYQHHEVVLIRRIRDLLYDQGFTISGARNRLAELAIDPPADLLPEDSPGLVLETRATPPSARPAADPSPPAPQPAYTVTPAAAPVAPVPLPMSRVRNELLLIRAMLASES